MNTTLRLISIAAAWMAAGTALAAEPPAELARWLIGQGLLLSLLGTAWVAAALLALSNLFVGLNEKAALFGVGAIAGAPGFKFCFTRCIVKISLHRSTP